MKINTLYELLRHGVEKFASRTAFDMFNGESVTYAEVGRRAAAVQEALVGAGVKAGDKVITGKFAGQELKLDGVDYTEKLAEILRSNNIRSVTVLRMEVPCCGGLEMAARRALEQCGRDLPWQVCTVHIDGTVTKN